MKTHRLMLRVRDKAGLLKLLLGLAFLFFGLLKQVNIAVEGKQKVRFSHLFPFQWFYSPVGQKFSNKNLYRRIQWVKKKWVTGLELPTQFIISIFALMWQEFKC